MSRLFGVPPEWLPTYWPLAVDFIGSVCRRSKGRFTPDSVLPLLKEGKWQLWLVVDGQTIAGAMTTTIHTYPTGVKECFIQMIGGEDAPKHVDVVDELAIWATEQGCSLLASNGREGWGRRCPSIGLVMRSILDREI